MISSAAHNPIFAFLPSFRKQSKNFGWSFPASGGCDNHFDSVDADHNSAAIKPIRDVFLIGDPLKIFNSVVGFVFVAMVDNIQFKWVGNEGNRDKAVDGETSNLSALRQLNFGIPSSRTSFQDVWVNVSPLMSVDVSSRSLNAPFATYFVKPFVTNNWFPEFSGIAKIINNGWLNFWKHALNGRFKVKHSLKTLVNEGCDQPSVVTPCLDDLRRDDAILLIDDRSDKAFASDAVKIGNLVSITESIHRKPPFAFKGFLAFIAIWEKRVLQSLNINSALPSFLGKHCTSSINAQNLLGSRSFGSVESLNASNAANSTFIRDFVKTFVVRNGQPKLFTHLSSPIYRMFIKAQMNHKAFGVYRQPDKFWYNIKEIYQCL